MNYGQQPQQGYGGGQQQQQTVVVMQPSGGGGMAGLNSLDQREWTTGICGCFEDCCSCIYAYCCFPCFLCTLASEMRERALGPFCCDRLFVVPMRTKVRVMYGIRGSICNDICCVTFCQFCSVLQMHREMKNHGQAALWDSTNHNIAHLKSEWFPPIRKQLFKYRTWQRHVIG